MFGYVVRKGERPEQIARALRINYGDLIAANASGKDAKGRTLRQEVIGRDMQTGQPIKSFAADDWKEGVTLRLPQTYSGQLGEVPPGMMGASGGGLNPDDPAVIAQANACTLDGNHWFDYDTGECHAYTKPAEETDACGSFPVVKAVQQALLNMGQSLPVYGADGSWGCESQKALDKSGKSFMELATQMGWGGCSGSVPKATGCGGGGTYVPPGKKKEGEACTGSECDTGLECVNGKCAKVAPPVVPGKTSWLTYVGIGLALAAGAVGVAYVAGDKKKTASKNPTRSRKALERINGIYGDKAMAQRMFPLGVEVDTYGGVCTAVEYREVEKDRFGRVTLTEVWGTIEHD